MMDPTVPPFPMPSREVFYMFKRVAMTVFLFLWDKPELTAHLVSSCSACSGCNRRGSRGPSWSWRSP